MAFQSVESLLLAARDAPVWQVVLEDDCRDRGSEREESWARMAGLWSAMQSAAADYDPARRSPSGLSGGNAARLEGPGPGLCGPFWCGRHRRAVRNGSASCMRRIVLPHGGGPRCAAAVLLPLQRRDVLPDEVIIQALYVAAGFGQVIATRASIAGGGGGVSGRGRLRLRHGRRSPGPHHGRHG